MTAEIEQKTGDANKYARILALSDDRRVIVDNMLIRGDSAAEVCRVIQKDWALYADVKPETLERQIQRYKLDKIQIPEAAKQQLIEALAVEHPRIAKKIERAVAEFDVEISHVRLVLAQEKRVQKWLEMGAGSMPSTQVREDIKLLHMMYRDLEQFYLETGKIRRAPKQLTGQLIDENGVLVEFEAELKQVAEKRRVIERVISLIKGVDYEVVDEQSASRDGSDSAQAADGDS